MAIKFFGSAVASPSQAAEQVCPPLGGVSPLGSPNGIAGVSPVVRSRSRMVCPVTVGQSGSKVAVVCDGDQQISELQ